MNSVAAAAVATSTSFPTLTAVQQQPPPLGVGVGLTGISGVGHAPPAAAVAPIAVAPPIPPATRLGQSRSDSILCLAPFHVELREGVKENYHSHHHEAILPSAVQFKSQSNSTGISPINCREVLH